MLSLKDSNLTSYSQIVDEQNELKKLRLILLEMNHDITLFLLDPHTLDLGQTINQQTKAALNSIDELASINPNRMGDTNAPVSSDKLINDFKELQKQTLLLANQRLTSTSHYQNTDFNAPTLEAKQHQVNAKIMQLVRLSHIGIQNESAQKNYRQLLKIKKLWDNTVSQSYIQLSYKLVDFTQSSLALQKKRVNSSYESLYSNLIELQQTLNKANHPIQLNLISQVIQGVESWQNSFNETETIATANIWSTETKLIRDQIFPCMNVINREITLIERNLKIQQYKIEEAVNQSDYTFSGLIIGIFGILFLFIFAILWSLEWMVFAPIKSVTHALKQESSNRALPHLKAASTAEINDLIHAFLDMEEEVAQRQKDLEHQAMHDHLTGLPNRFLLHQRVEYQILASERLNQEFVLFLMDLDFFKDINDTLGHATGDQLLIDAAQRIQSIIGKGDTLARLGGDEFAILLPTATAQSAHFLATKIIESFNQPFELQQSTVNIAISIGAATYPSDGKDTEILLQCADMAMYSAKRTRAGYAKFNPKDNIYSKEHLSLINDLPAAIEKEEFELYFQPQIDLTTGNTIGAEALLRWQHKKHGFISPEKIIEAAERSGLLHKLTFKIIQKSLQACQKWHNLGHAIKVSVNLSAHDLADAQLSNRVGQLLKRYHIGHNKLTLEVTETAMMENLTLSLQQLNQLHELGVNISVDDFGTGFSSLAYLKRLPVDELKIDKSFIVDITTDEDDKNIVNSTINLGHNLDLKVVTEGIETQSALKTVQAMGCDYAQGYHIGKPMPLPAFIAYLEAHEN